MAPLAAVERERERGESVRERRVYQILTNSHDALDPQHFHLLCRLIAVWLPDRLLYDRFWASLIHGILTLDKNRCSSRTRYEGTELEEAE